MFGEQGQLWELDESGKDNSGDELQTKLNEIQQVQAVRMRSLEKRLAEKDDKLQFYEQKMHSMTKDFEYNLHVIEERDKDIEELTSNMFQLKKILEEKNNAMDKMREDMEKIRFRQEQVAKDNIEEREVLLERLESFKFENKTLKMKLGERAQELESFKQMKVGEEDRLREGIAEAVKCAFESAEKSKREKERMKLDFEVREKQQIETRRIHEQGLEQQYDRVIAENENLLRQLNDQKSQAMEINRKQSEEITYQKQRNVQYQIDIGCLTKEIEALKVTHSSWQAAFKERLNAVNEEKEDLILRMNRKKQKYQRQLQEANESAQRKIQTFEQQNESETRIKEQILREQRIEIEKQHLKHTYTIAQLQDKERRQQKEIEDIEEKFKTFRKNQELSIKQQLSDAHVIEFHLKQKTEELNRVLKENEGINLKLMQLQKEFSCLEAENELLIQELIPFRKAAGAKQHQATQQIEKSKKHQHIHQNHLHRGRTQRHQPNSNIQFEEDNMLNKRSFSQNDSNLILNHSKDDEDVESYQKLFSDDMGPASPMRSRNFNLDFLSNNKSASMLVNSLLLKNRLATVPRESHVVSQVHGQGSFHPSQKNNSILQEKLALLQSEINAYKHLIETMAVEMENVQRKLQLNQEDGDRVRSENAELKQRIADLSMDIMNYRERSLKTDYMQKAAYDKEQEIDEKDKQINNISKTLAKRENQIQNLKKEREQLLAISSELRQKLLEQEDIIEQRENLLSNYKENYILINKLDVRQSSSIPLPEFLNQEHSKQLTKEDDRKNGKQQSIQDQEEEEDQGDKHTQINSRSATYLQNKLSSPKPKEMLNMRNQNNPKESVIDGLFKKIRTDNKYQIFKANVPKYDQFMEIDNLQKQIKGSEEDLCLISGQKMISDRGEDPKYAQYIPNSQKATQFQLESEQRRKQSQRSNSAEKRKESHKNISESKKNDTQNPKHKIRNYSIKEVEDD